MSTNLGVSDIIAMASALIALCAMVVAVLQARYARRNATEAKRQADAALGEVEPLIFLDRDLLKTSQAIGGGAVLTIVNHNRRDIRLLSVEIKSDRGILVTLNSGELRDVIAAAFDRSRHGDDGDLIIDLTHKHHVVEGSAIGTAGSRFRLPLHVGHFGDLNYTRETVDLKAIVRYVLLDTRHVEREVDVFATVPFRN